MFQRAIKNVFGFLFWSCVVLGVLVVTVATVTANYLALSYAFYLLKYDSQPIAEDQFVGPVFRALCPQATMAQFYAAALAVGLSIGFFLVFKEVFGVYDSWLAKKLHHADGNAEQAQAFHWDVVEKAVSLVLLVGTLCWVIAWDAELFRYRGAAQIAGLDDPDKAVDLVTWHQLSEQPGFALDATRIGTWGYIGLTAALCLGLEIAARKSRRYADRIFAEIDSAGLGEGQGVSTEPVLYGYNAEGEPVYDGNSPLAYDAEGNSLGSSDPEQSPKAERQPNAVHVAASGNTESQPLFVVPPMRTAHGDPSIASGVAGTENAQRIVGGEAAEVQDQADVLDCTVIGTGERIAWISALQDDALYYCDLGKRVVWDRSTYEALHGHQPAPEPTPQAA